VLLILITWCLLYRVHDLDRYLYFSMTATQVYVKTFLLMKIMLIIKNLWCMCVQCDLYYIGDVLICNIYNNAHTLNFRPIFSASDDMECLTYLFFLIFWQNHGTKKRFQERRN
jgi:hypothetical protein